jgi:transcriptional regulator with PAS, ATPase and Fis domain
MQQHLLVLLGMTARMIENRLIDQCFRHAHPVHFHSRPEFVYTLHEGRLAVSDDGHILAANRSALFQLGLQSVADIRSRRIEDIFQTSQEDLLHRSTLSSFHPVVTYRAHASHRFFAVMRRPAVEASALQVGNAASQTPMPGRVLTPTRTPLPRPLVSSGAPVGPTLTDPTLARQLDVARRVIARQTPVLLCGETGSGKEVFARAVHEGSPRSSGAFVAVNCASLPESLIESELFGYRAGAFTGAQRNGRRGKILQADGGTLFLDEIGDMPLELQARLLRVLEERQVTPLGAEETVSVDFQLLSASHRNLMELVEAGRFREDLYYRLAGVTLQMPPLRERPGDIVPIAQQLLADVAAELGLPPARFDDDARAVLMGYPWPGNIRELRNEIARALALGDGRTVQAGTFSRKLLQGQAGVHAEQMNGHALPASGTLAERLDAIEAMVLRETLLRHRWNKTHAAKELGLSRVGLRAKLQRFGLEDKS